VIVKQISEQVLPQNVHNARVSGSASIALDAIPSSRYLIHAVQMYSSAAASNTLSIGNSDLSIVYWASPTADNSSAELIQLNITIATAYDTAVLIQANGLTNPTLNVQYTIESK
jgi:hypothetical protein